MQTCDFDTLTKKVVDENGEPLVVYHDTNSKKYVIRETGEDWDLLDWKQRQEWEGRDDWDDYREERDFYTFDRRNSRTTNEMPAHFFSPNADPYHEYGERRISAFLNLKNPIVNPTIPNRGERDNAGADYMDELRKLGYDGFIREYDGKVEEINVFDSNQIKSADAVTYDDAGNVIPLSERFNLGNNDIRHSIRTAWSPNFPKAVAQTTRANIMAKYADIFRRAKAGDVEAAEELVEKVVKVDKIRQLGKDHPNARIVAPVMALEATGHNQIPRMYARYIANILSINADTEIVQTVRARSRTRRESTQRSVGHIFVRPNSSI